MIALFDASLFNFFQSVENKPFKLLIERGPKIISFCSKSVRSRNHENFIPYMGKKVFLSLQFFGVWSLAEPRKVVLVHVLVNTL